MDDMNALSAKLQVRVSQADLDYIDSARGDVSRGVWVRRLVQASQTQPPEPKAPPPPPQQVPPMVPEPVKATPAPTKSQTAPAPPRQAVLPRVRRQVIEEPVMTVVGRAHKPNAAGDICTVCGWRLSKAPAFCEGK